MFFPKLGFRIGSSSLGGKSSKLRRGGREAEGAPLLREYGSKAHRGFESLPLRHYYPAIYAPVAQLDRVPGYEPGGREFESLRARQFPKLDINKFS